MKNLSTTWLHGDRIVTRLLGSLRLLRLEKIHSPGIVAVESTFYSSDRMNELVLFPPEEKTRISLLTQPMLDGNHSCLGAVGNFELGEDGTDMIANSPFGKVKV